MKAAPGYRHGRRLAATLAALAAVFCLWALAALAVDRPFLPGPASSFSALCRLLADGGLARHASASLVRVLAAIVLAFVPAGVLGLAAGRSARLDALLSPLIYLLHPLPKVAFLPVILVALGLGEASKISLVSLIVFSQILVAARDSASRVPAETVDSVRSLGAGPLALARLVILPATLPDLITALRVSLGTAIAVLFLAETFATDTGLGWFIVDAWARVAYPEMYAGILALSAVGLGLFSLLDAAERALCPWRRY